MNEKCYYDLEYSRKLKKLYDSKYIFAPDNVTTNLKDFTSNSSLTNCSENIREFFVTTAEYNTSNAESIKKEVVQPLEKLITQQTDEGVKIEKEYKKVDKEYKDYCNNLEKAKTKFLLLSSQAEVSVRDYELGLLSHYELNIEKLKKNRDEKLREAKESEKIYIHHLSITNSFRINFIEENKRIFSLLESLDYSFSIQVKEAFQKYIAYNNANLTNQNFDLDKLKQSISTINIDADLQNFIKFNKVDCDYPSKHDYIEYGIKLRENPPFEYNYPPEAVLKIVNTVYSNFEYKKTKWDFNEETIKLKICYLIKKIFEDSLISDEELKMINVIIQDKDYKLYFLSHLNSYRIKGIFNLKEKNFEILGEILKKILNSHVYSSTSKQGSRKGTEQLRESRKFSENEDLNTKTQRSISSDLVIGKYEIIEIENPKIERSESTKIYGDEEYNLIHAKSLQDADAEYYEACKYVIILSQTFKCGKLSLQSKIENEEVLKKKEFWENMIQRKNFI